MFRASVILVMAVIVSAGIFFDHGNFAKVISVIAVVCSGLVMFCVIVYFSVYLGYRAYRNSKEREDNKKRRRS
jgi:membrane protein implicated in regulation of membrane protease activity